MLRATMRGILAHKLRLSLTALSVMLGVAFVAGTLVLTDTIGQSFDRVFATATAGTDVSVRSTSEFTTGAAPVTDDVVARVRDVAGVASAEGTLLGYAQVVLDDEKRAGTRRSTPIGTAWIAEPELNPFRLRSGRGPQDTTEVVIDTATAEAGDIAVGDRVRVAFQGPADDFEVVGIAGFGETDEVVGASLAAFTTPTARRVLNRPEGFDTVEVAAVDGVTQAELRTRVAGVLDDGFEAVTGQAAAKESAQAVKQDLGFFSTLLLVFAGVSLFVGAFIIVNTFQILVAQRSRELGLLRALGATAAQVRRSVVAEAAVVGLVASVLGLGAGVGVALALQRLLESFGVDLPSAETRILPRTVVVALVVGIVVTVVSAVVPARRASRVPPLAALRDVGFDPTASLRRRTVVGALVAAVGFAVLLAGTAGMGNGAANVGLGALVGFLGASLMAPALVRPGVAIIAAPWAGRRISARLGRENAVRNPRRTAATAAALMIGLALVSLVSIFAASARRSTSAIIDDVFRADFVVNSGSEASGGFSPDLVTRLDQLPEIATVAEFRVGEWRLDGQEKFLSAASPDGLGGPLALDVIAGRLADLGDGGLLVAEEVATSQGWEVGDIIDMEFARSGAVPIRIDGVFEANQITGAYLLALTDYEANFADQLAAFALVTGSPSSTPAAVRSAIDDVVAGFPGVEVTDQDEFKEQIAGRVTEILNLFYALLGLAIVIAVLGVVNTLALSVFERTRELGLLRAVGTSRRQIGAMVRTEGAIISVLGAVLGLVIGLVVALAMLASLREKGITETAVPTARLLVFVALAGLAGLLAAALPARRAARIDILAAIAQE